MTPRDLYYNKSIRMTSEISMLHQRIWIYTKGGVYFTQDLQFQIRVRMVDSIITFNAPAFKIRSSESSSARKIKLR